MKSNLRTTDDLAANRSIKKQATFPKSIQAQHIARIITKKPHISKPCGDTDIALL